MAIGTAERARRLTGQDAVRRGGPLGHRVWAARWCYLFALPNLILAVMFTLYPTVASWYYSFLDWSGFTSDSEWVGLANYREAIDDPYFWDAFRRSFVFMFAAVPIKMALSLIVAIMLNDKALKLAPIFRTLFFLPVVTTAAIVGIVMTFVFSPHNGPVNQALTDLGIVSTPVSFLSDPDTALWTVIAVYVWKSFGITMIYWLAALQVVPQDLYEAARLDGANRWHLHRTITLPLIVPFAAIIALISIVSALNVFALVQTMTGGGPFYATEIMEVYIYRNAFGEGGLPRLGYASAAAVVFGVTVLVLSLLQGWALRIANAKRAQIKAQG